MPQYQLKTALEHEIPELKLSGSDVDLLAYARDTWPMYQIRLQQGTVGSLPGLVVWPDSTAQVAAVYRFAAARRIPVTPIGASSGVVGGGIPEEGGIVMDLKRLDRELEVQADDGIAIAGVGWNGMNLENELNRYGVTAGHFPSSLMCSSLGGWFAARSAGQLSTRYGKWEDRVRGVEWVYPDGTCEWLDAEGWGEGAIELLLGSEGTLGVATRVKFRVDPLAEARLFRSYEFGDVASGIEAMRRLLQNDVYPAVVRLYDPFDTLLHSNLKSAAGHGDAASGGRVDPELAQWLKRAGKWVLRRAERYALTEPGLVQRMGERLARSALLILMFEGPAESAAWQATTADELLAGLGKPLGEGPGRAWYRHRYNVSFKQAALFSSGGFVDTMEVAFPWSRLWAGYEAVRQALIGDVLLLAHFSHVYDTGGGIYFTFTGFRRDPKDSERAYREVWRRGLDAVVRAGGTITHHHGVGLLKARWMADELKDGYAWLRNLKAAADPERIANPGKLGL